MYNQFKALLLGALVVSMSTVSFAHGHDHDDDYDKVRCLIGGLIPTYTGLDGKCVDGCKDLKLVTGETDKTVMQVTEHSNSILGYKVRLFSANSGKLKNIFVGSQNIPYTAKYNGNAVTLSSGGSVVTTQWLQLAPINITKDLKVTIPANPGASKLAGYYADTLTFEIAAN